MSALWWKPSGVSEIAPAPVPLQLLILDCDGVLIDSEPPSNRLIAMDLRARGLALSDDQARQRFSGKSLSMIAAELAAEDGLVLPPDWPARTQVLLVAMLEQEAALIDGAREMLEAVAALGLPVRVASNSSHAEMAVKFRRTGLERMLTGRLHSAQDVARPKPWPDLFLSAAAAEGVDPAACLVVEDSDTGLRAALEAGMACVVLRPEGEHRHDHAAIAARPAAVSWIRHLQALEPILTEAMRSGDRAVIPETGS